MKIINQNIPIKLWLVFLMLAMSGFAVGTIIARTAKALGF
jgi:hypothetical protein